jgi:hypothetical protein
MPCPSIGRYYRVPARTRLMSEPRRLALATLMAGSVFVGARAAAADPTGNVVPQSDPQGSISAQPAGAPSAPWGRPNTVSPPPKSDLRRGTDQPASAVHRPTPNGQGATAPDASKRNQPSAAPVPVHRTQPTVVPAQPVRQVPTPTATPPPDAHPPERVPTQPQTKASDPRDSGPHADRTSRDRAER